MQEAQVLLSDYELSQIQQIQSWKTADPAVALYKANFMFLPFSRLTLAFLPIKAIHKSLQFTNNVAEWLTDKEDILRTAGISQIVELQTRSLELSDHLADHVHNWGIALASAEGGSAGALGLLGIAFDIPAIITLALRTVHKIGVCYGFEANTDAEKQFVISVLAASGSNEMSEKIAAIATLHTIRSTLTRQLTEDIAMKAASETLGREAGLVTIQNIARQLGINITRRKALQLIPVLGAAIGASVNGWFVREAGWAARRMYQERWMAVNQKIPEKP